MQVLKGRCGFGNAVVGEQFTGESENVPIHDILGLTMTK